MQRHPHKPSIHRSAPALLLLAWLMPAVVLAQEPPGVELSTVERGPVYEETRLHGTVNALRISRLSTSVPGRVDAMHVEVGDTVARGEGLVTLDDEQARHELAGARARRQEAQANLAEARRRVTEAQSVGAGRHIATTELRARESAMDIAEAALARARAEVGRYRTALDRHRIEAPFDGVVSTRDRDLGEWVTPGDALMTLVDLQNLRLDFQVPQAHFPRLHGNSELRLVSGPAARDPVPLEIATRVPVNDPVSRTFLLRALAPEAPPLIPGMAVEAVLRIGTGEEGLTVPRDALNRYPEGRVTVWIAEPAQGEDRYSVREKRVETGSGFGERVEIRSGLEAGQRVVSRGNETLDEGMKVRLSERGGR